MADQPTTVTFNVPDISCGHCKASIESAVNDLGGVDSAEVTIDQRTVDIAYDASVLEESALVAAIEAQGYAVAR